MVYVVSLEEGDGPFDRVEVSILWTTGQATLACRAFMSCVVLTSVTLRSWQMIKSFRHKGLEKFVKTGSKAGIRAQHAAKLRVQLTALEHAGDAKDMGAPGWGLHRLKGDRSNFYAISMSGNWRLIFWFEFQDVVDVDYVEYH